MSSNFADPSSYYTLIDRLHNVFEPFPAPSQVYVHLNDVRGGWDVKRVTGARIKRSEAPTCQLYSGHRGVGKSTELLRLKQWLEDDCDFFVVYFAADQADVEPEDVSYADVILACTRNLVQMVRLETNENPILTWLGNRWGELKDLATSEVEFSSLSIEQKLFEFGKLSANLRAVPSIRAQVRKTVDAHTVSLVEAVNEFIELATAQLQAQGKRGIVIMADNLDRITYIRTAEDARSNHDQIFLDRSEQMKGLKCHVIYTAPIALVCGRGVEVENRYGDCADVLPMVVVQNRDGSENLEGMEAMRKILRLRVEMIDPELAKAIETRLFESSELLDLVCAASGGHMRMLMQFMQKALDWTDVLPIQKRAVNRALSSARQTYRDAINFEWWDELARVHGTKQLPRDNRSQQFLADRCVLQYFEEDEEGEINEWFDVHPLILKIELFQSALSRLKGE
ncbi:MAG: ATP-binding protein [Coleofasciculaceae cyanobacterium RL_1_1]|nr:ATP-binding protein [Coleofasciculaceae cyanobacterium RL_1_1]